MSLLRWKQKIMSPDGGVLRTGGGGSGGAPNINGQSGGSGIVIVRYAV